MSATQFNGSADDIQRTVTLHQINTSSYDVALDCERVSDYYNSFVAVIPATDIAVLETQTVRLLNKYSTESVNLTLYGGTALSYGQAVSGRAMMVYITSSGAQYLNPVESGLWLTGTSSIAGVTVSYKKSGDVVDVILSGNNTASTSMGALVTTLPAGYRPTHNIACTCSGSMGAVVTMIVYTNGEINCYNMMDTYATDGMHFNFVR